MKPVTTLVVLAAAKEMRLLRHAGTGKGLEEVVHRRASGYPGSDVEFADRAPRSHGGAARFGHGERRDEEDAEMALFAAHVLDEVAREWAGGGYARILLAASPRLLGHLRDHMPDDLRANVMADIDKDLVKVPLIDLPAHLGPVLAV